ncbi:DUF2145 domain-containing protein [Schlegelella sp. S2-27]|uniref:DUF2145 domain-containing protein n=1 Tax=Caldimonas mangrovi TaxID=2944811 RepID=A0ABT0YST1_9BURK|nr:DUF2145 domain-containing protein [Caldimonas mangrovi]MCM5681800.1 DUF2145 domain-containing protein [Caldimonas mangrovi]
MTSHVFTALALAAALVAGPAQAGRSCQSRPLSLQTLQQGLALAEHTARRLEASGAQVAVIARNGQDLSRYGLRYSHLGLAYRDEQAGRPVWRVVHKLNHCGTARAAVYRQGFAEFFLDDLHVFEAGIVPLTPRVQQPLLAALRDNRRATTLHTPAYNMVAYPWSVRYQQSNQWAIETLASALEPAVRNREQAQAWLKLQDYRPTTLRIGALTRLGGRMTAANIAFDDHPNDKRYADRIETVTVDSVFRWLERSGLGRHEEVVR